MTALQKPGSGVRGMVAGDVIRRLVARTIAQQLSETVERATAPFQYALSTKAGCECVAHALQGLTDLDPEATVLSIDGISAYDLISRGHVDRIGQRGWRGTGFAVRQIVLWSTISLLVGGQHWDSARG